MGRACQPDPVRSTITVPLRVPSKMVSDMNGALRFSYSRMGGGGFDRERWIFYLKIVLRRNGFRFKFDGTRPTELFAHGYPTTLAQLSSQPLPSHASSKAHTGLRCQNTKRTAPRFLTGRRNV